MSRLGLYVDGKRVGWVSEGATYRRLDWIGLQRGVIEWSGDGTIVEDEAEYSVGMDKWVDSDPEQEEDSDERS